MKTRAFGVRRWAVYTVLLYGLSVSVLAAPLVIAAFVRGESMRGQTEVLNSFSLYTYWQYWVSVAVVMLLQALFLLAPLEVVRERPVARARWVTLAAVSGLMCGLLICALGFALVEFIFQGGSSDLAVPSFWLSVALGGLGWIVWGVLFSAYALARNPASVVKTAVDRLLAGSIAELLIAVPCHVYVRNKDYCCAGFLTFTGLATGLAVMLFAFGPAVFILFVERARRLSKAQSEGDTDGYAESEAPRFGRQSAYTLFWAGGAFLFFAALRLGELWVPEHGPDLEKAGRTSFLLMSALAVYYGYYALKQRERGRLWAVAAMSFISEAALLVFVFK